MGTADKVLKEQVESAINKLDESADKANCDAHAPLAEGVKVLLEIQKAVLDGNIDTKNSIRVGNVTVTGTAAIGLVVAGYAVLKLHGVF